MKSSIVPMTSTMVRYFTTKLPQHDSCHMTNYCLQVKKVHLPQLSIKVDLLNLNFTLNEVTKILLAADNSVQRGV